MNKGGTNAKKSHEKRQLIEEWEVKELEWENRLDLDSPSSVDEGLTIYEALIELSPKEIRFRMVLISLLIKQGEDLKLRKESYNKAKRNLERVVMFDPDNRTAFYR